MRVAPPSHRRDDERGAVALIVAISSVMLFGFAAYAIDAGSLWQTRRNMITATDAGALASASDYSVGDNGCPDVAKDYVSRNRPDAEFGSGFCTVVGAGTDFGYTTVRAFTNVDFTFAGIFGLTDKDVYSTTTAEWGVPLGASGLRPLGLCIDANSELKSWLNLPDGPTGEFEPTIRIDYIKDDPDACNDGDDVPGNWGTVYFDDGSPPGQNTIIGWIIDGCDCTIEVDSSLSGKTGAAASYENALSGLQSSGESFFLPVYDDATGNGANASYQIVAFVQVVLVSFEVKGPESGRFLELKFTLGVVAGPCCNPDGIDTGARAIRICDIDTQSPSTTELACGP